VAARSAAATIAQILARSFQLLRQPIEVWITGVTLVTGAKPPKYITRASWPINQQGS
jgi:hypothetical protein